MDFFTPTEIGQFQTESFWGLRDMVGNVWQFMADMYYDDHTRRVVLKGGSSYDLQNIGRWSDQPDYETSNAGLWYFSQQYGIQYNSNPTSAGIFRVDRHNIWMQMSDSFDR